MKFIGPYTITEGEIPEGSITSGFAKEIGDIVGVDWNQTAVEELARGIEHETEHWESIQSMFPGLDKKDRPFMAAKLAMDHLSSDKEYYKKLKKMEKA